MKMAQSVSNKCRIPPLSLLAVLVIVELLCLVNLTNCTKIFNIGWNTTNPIFRIDNTDHIIDVNKGNIPFEYDQVNIICPVYSPGTHEQDAEKYIIYNVSKEEYDTCRITNPNPRIIAVCDKPNKLMYFTITFRSFTPQPGGLEFLPGQDYYFISTSTNSDLHRRIGGRCSTNHMKVVFKVCCDPSKENDTNQKKALAARTTTTTSTTTMTTSSTTTTKLSTTSRPSTSSKPTSFKTALGPSINVKATTKKSEEFNRDKHPNDDIVKNEELTSRAANSVGRSHYRTVALSCLVMVLTTRLLSR